MTAVNKMILKIKGSNKDNRKLIENAAFYYAEKLLGLTLLKTIKININLKRGMLSEDDAEGTCIWDDWDDLRKTPRNFTIELDSGVNIRNLLINLAHEMVHMKQWVKGDMYEYSNPHMVRFMKKKYDMSNIDYWDFPWEIEAYGRQLGLFIRWCEAEGIGDREDMLEEA
jgi:hypothetical protein